MQELTRVMDLNTGMRNINLRVIVLSQAPIRLSNQKDREICDFLVADETACANLVLFDELIHPVHPGDILHIEDCMFYEHKGVNVIGLVPYSSLKKVGEFTMKYSTAVNKSSRTEPYIPVNMIRVNYVHK